MSKNCQQALSSRTAFHASGSTHAVRSLPEADLAGIVGGAQHAEIAISIGLSFSGPDTALAVYAGLRQMPVGILDPDIVPWDELTPAKALAIGAELRYA